MLSGYQYDTEYRSPNKHANANCLSRLQLSDHVRNENDEIQEINRVQLESLPISVAHVRKATRRSNFVKNVGVNFDKTAKRSSR